jgi:hypothetical protein
MEEASFTILTAVFTMASGERIKCTEKVINKLIMLGTLYYSNGQPAYEGEWFEDKFQGKGILHNEAPSILYGSFDYSDFDNINE